MIFFVLTLFPQMVADALRCSVLKRAADAGRIDIRCVDIRDFAANPRKQVDDAPYGGGAGMLMTPGPVCAACEYAKSSAGADASVLYLSPQGKRYQQSVAEEFSKRKALILLCGHYEGIDQRALDEIGAEEISLGDFILTGGEIAAMAVIDSVARLLPGVLGKDESYLNESFSDGLLEYPQYTRPPVFRERAVPDVLLSGHHKNIAMWRRRQSLLKTVRERPDLLASARLTQEETAYTGASKGAYIMKGIITVLGGDQVGIIAKVCLYLSDKGINILDISQTIVQGYFHMMMIVDISGNHRFEDLVVELLGLGEAIGVQIKLQHEDIFNSMHRI
ncbi:MAG: tRNA (guanosine(37)-N1)-methyltransferase TrmD [Clostridiales bacterium]|jgi:tRNA (guanine37-N1)-methyltransferase|nr:tRNA (guanosine(37)-N1)-methyltransferase TrmD [Clostridiales bacterium]